MWDSSLSVTLLGGLSCQCTAFPWGHGLLANLPICSELQMGCPCQERILGKPTAQTDRLSSFTLSCSATRLEPSPSSISCNPRGPPEGLP